MHYAQLELDGDYVSFPNTKEEALRMAIDAHQKTDVEQRNIRLYQRLLEEFSNQNPELHRTVEQSGLWENLCEAKTRAMFFSARTKQYRLLVESLPTEAELIEKKGDPNIHEFSSPMESIPMEES